MQYTTFELNGLRADTTYKIELRAHNAIGSSSPAQIRVKTARGEKKQYYSYNTYNSRGLVGANSGGAVGVNVSLFYFVFVSIIVVVNGC